MPNSTWSRVTTRASPTTLSSPAARVWYPHPPTLVPRAMAGHGVKIHQVWSPTTCEQGPAVSRVEPGLVWSLCPSAANTPKTTYTHTNTDLCLSPGLWRTMVDKKNHQVWSPITCEPTAAVSQVGPALVWSHCLSATHKSMDHLHPHQHRLVRIVPWAMAGHRRKRPLENLVRTQPLPPVNFGESHE